MTLFGTIFGSYLAFKKHIDNYLTPNGTKEFYEIFYLSLLESVAVFKKAYPSAQIQQVNNIEAILKAPGQRKLVDHFFEIEIYNVATFRHLLTNKEGLKQLATHLLKIIKDNGGHLELNDAQVIIQQCLLNFKDSLLNQLSEKQGIVAILEQAFESQEIIEEIKQNLGGIANRLDKLTEGQDDIKQTILSSHKKLLQELKTFPVLAYDEQKIIEQKLMPHLNRQLDDAKKLLKQRNPKQALDILKSLYQDFSKELLSPQFLSTVEINIGNCYSQLGDLDSSSKYYIRATESDPSNIEYLYNAANAYQHLGQPDEIEKIADQILDLDASSVKGYALKLLNQPVPKNVEQFIQNIPKKFKKSIEVLIALAWICGQQNRFDLQLKYLKKALKGNQKNEQIKLYVAYFLASKHIQQIKLVDNRTLSKKEIEDLKESKKLYLEIWKKIKNTPSAKRKIDVLLNISIIYFKLNKTSKALAFLNKYASIDPHNIHIQFHKTLFLYDLGRLEEALAIAQKADLDPIPDFYLLLSELLYNLKDKEGAIKYTKQFIEKYPDAPNQGRAHYFYIISLINVDRVVEAKKALNSLKPDLIDDFGYQLLNIFLYEKDNEKKVFLEQLEELANLANEETELRNLVDLAQALTANFKWYSAIKIFRLFLHNYKPHPLTYQYLKCLVHITNWDDALEICNKIKSDFGFIPQYAEIECYIYQRQKKFEKALPTSTKLMEYLKDDIEYKIQTAQIYIQLKNETVAIRLLEEIKINASTNIMTIDALVVNWIKLERYKDALFLSYEYRRLTDSEDAHKYYWKVVFNLDAHLVPYFKPPEKVEENSAVTLKFPNTETIETFILEDLTKGLKRNELNKQDKRYNQLLDKQIGEEIIWNKTNLGIQKAKIVDIRTKWQHAYFDTLKSLEVRFASHDFHFGRFTIEEVDIFIKQRLELRKSVDDFFHNIAKEQKKGNYSSMAMVASFLKMGPLELYDIYVNNTSLGIRCADGSDNNYQAVEKIDKKKSKRLAVDIFGLLTLYRLNIGQEVINYFGKIKIAKSTLEEIDRVHSLAKFDLEKAINANLNNQEEKPNQSDNALKKNQENFDYYNGLANWVDQYCEMMPFVLDKEQIGEKEYDCFTKSSSDTLLMALQHNLILLSDDFIYRKRADGRFKLTCIWSQALLFHLHHHKQLDAISYHEKLITLINANYNYVNFNSLTLQIAANQSPEIFSKVANRLGKSFSIFEQALLFGLGFLAIIWRDNQKTILYKKFLTVSVLVNVCTYDKSDLILQLAYNAITSERITDSIHPNFIYAVEEWARLSGINLKKV